MHGDFRLYLPLQMVIKGMSVGSVGTGVALAEKSALRMAKDDVYI